MAYLEDKVKQAKGLVGARVEIPVHYDLWMRGATRGTVQSAQRNGEYVRVKMDHPQVKRLLKVWRIDFDYMKVLS